MFFQKKIKYREKRLNKEIKVNYRLNDSPSSWEKARILNISENGARILSDHSPEINEIVELEIPQKSLSKREILQVIGNVVWISSDKGNKFKYGVAFKKKHVSYSRENNWFQVVADKHCYFLKHYTNNCVGHIAENLHQLKSVYQILYNEYVRRSLCKHDGSKMFYTVYSFIPSTRTFLLRKNERLLGTVSLIPDSPLGLPMEVTFPEEIQKLRDKGCKMAEIGMLALNSQCIEKKHYSLSNFCKQAYLFKLFKTMFDYARLTQTSHLILGCHPGHEKLYKYLNFERISSDVRFHHGANGKPGILMCMDIETAVRNNILLGEGPGLYFLKNPLPAEAFERYFSWSAQTAKEFLWDVKPLWHSLNSNHKAYLQTCYPFLKLEAQEALV